MSGYAVALTLSSVLALGLLLVFWLTSYQKMRGIVQKYPLFSARDELVGLSLQGKFQNDPELYDFYMKVCNGLLLSTKELNFRFFIALLVRLDPSEEGKQIRSRIERACPEIQEFDQQLWLAVRSIIYQNSTLVRILVTTGLIEYFQKWISGDLEPMQPVRQYLKLGSMCHVG